MNGSDEHDPHSETRLIVEIRGIPNHHAFHPELLQLFHKQLEVDVKVNTRD